jgi:nitroreductase
MLADLVTKNRSFRRFYQEPPVVRAELEQLVEAARLAASGGNLQALKYFLSAEPATNARIFPTLRWAGYLKDWAPAENERPTGYIILLRDNEITTNFMIDHGISSELMRLAAIEKGIGSCLIGSIDRVQLRAALEIPTKYEILLVLALGRPSEKVVVEDAQGGEIKYFRDASGILHVPKRPTRELIIN